MHICETCKYSTNLGSLNPKYHLKCTRFTTWFYAPIDIAAIMVPDENYEQKDERIFLYVSPWFGCVEWDLKA